MRRYYKLNYTVLLRKLVFCGLPFFILFFNVKSICRFFYRDCKHAFSTPYLGEASSTELDGLLSSNKDSLRIFSYKHRHHRASGYSLLLGTLLEKLYHEDMVVYFPDDHQPMRFFKENYVRSRLTSLYSYPVNIRHAEYSCLISEDVFKSYVTESIYHFKAPLASFYFLKDDDKKGKMAVYIYKNSLIVAPL